MKGLMKARMEGKQVTCPRCGGIMDAAQMGNVFSRYADIAICSKCETDEALRDAAGFPLPMKLWDSIKKAKKTAGTHVR